MLNSGTVVHVEQDFVVEYRLKSIRPQPEKLVLTGTEVVKIITVGTNEVAED